MKTYYIYNISTDEFLGEVKATSVLSAELKAIETLTLNIPSEYVAAFTEKF